MESRVRVELAQALRRKREAVLRSSIEAEAGLDSLPEDRETEFEERAQRERTAALLARLDDRGLREVDEIHAALARLLDGSYGTCRDCGDEIPLARLRALPTSILCVDCERLVETRHPVVESPETPHAGALPPEFGLLLDREVEEVLWELVRTDHRLDPEELRIVCRHGVIHLAGAVPSEIEHQILLRLVGDVAGCQDVVDHVLVSRVPWERSDRTRSIPLADDEVHPERFERVSTEDVLESSEQGLTYTAPDRPLPEEE